MPSNEDKPLVPVPSSVPETKTTTGGGRTAADTTTANHHDSGKISVPDSVHSPTTNYTRLDDDMPSHHNNEVSVPPPAYGSEAAPSQINLTTVRLNFGLVLLLGFVLCLLMNYHIVTWILKWVVEKEMADSCAIGDSADALSECLGAQGVYRVSFTLFMFFLIHYLMSHHHNLCMEPKSRIEFNHGHILIKIVIAIAFLFLTFVIPNSFFVFYAWLAFVLSIFFLIGQLLVLIEFAYSWAEDWSQREDTRYGKALLFLTVLMIIGAIVIVSIGFKFFGSNSDCSGNQAALSLTLIAGLFYLALSVQIGKGTIVPAAVVFIYTAWTCFSALSSDSPPGCAAFTTSGALQLILSGVFTAASLIVSTLSAATSHDAFTTTDIEETGLEKDAILLQHFHLMMMLASAYLSMLVTNFTIVGSSSMASIYGDRNSASLAAKLSSEGLCVILFLISLAAPYCCKNREF
jgi:serine incorporator 1/3